MPSRPPTVLQVLPALDSGGVEQVVADLAAGLAQAGWRPLVASAGGAMVAAIEAAGARHVTLPLATRNPLAFPANAARLAALIEAEGVDLIHAHSRAPAWAARAAARRAGRPFVTTYHSPYGEGFPGKRRYNSVLAAGDRVIAVSRFLADHLIARHATDPARVRIIPNGVDPARFDPAALDPARARALRAAWDIPPGAPVILLPARLTGWKGQRVLIEALPRLARAEAVAVLAGADRGRGAFAAELRAQAARLGLAARVRLPGPVADMAAALAAAEVVVNASTAPEGFGLVLIEAQAMGRPVIATRHGAARELILEGETGFLVPPADPAALAAALDRVLALAPAQARTLAEAARTQAARYTVAAMRAATLALYRELL